MSEEERYSITGDTPYGKLPVGFTMTLPARGYLTISGLNNAGKTTILQWLFSRFTQSLYIPTERGIVRPTIDSGTLRLAQYIDAFKRNVHQQPLDVAFLGYGFAAHGTAVTMNDTNSYTEGLLSSMIRDKGITDSITELGEYVRLFRLGERVTDRNDQILIDGRSITQMGTGARSLLVVMMALIHPDYGTVLLEEPELFLEPRAQKTLRDLLLKKGTEKRIIVATHSHLMLNRTEGQYKYNFYIEDDGASFSELKTTATKTDLRNLTFKLLGASFDDLMLPENYLIVEGGSDRIIMTRVLELLNPAKASKVQVAFVQGIHNALPSVNAIAEMVRPYYAEDSVYKDRVVCMLDEPVNADEHRSVSELRRHLNRSDTRLFTLGKGSDGRELDLEMIIPAALYDRTSYKKSGVLTEIARLKSARNHSVLGKYKSEVAAAIAAVLEPADLDREEMAILRAAAEKALEPI